MEQNNDDDFQQSKPKSPSFPKTRNKLSSKRRMKLQCKKKCSPVLYSPVSCYYGRNTSSFVAETVETDPYEQDCEEANNSDSLKNCKILDLNKQTDSITIELSSSGEENVNPVTHTNSEQTSEMDRMLSDINKPPLHSKASEIIQGAAVSANEEPIQQHRLDSIDVIEHGRVLTNTASDEDSSDASLGKLNNCKTDSASEVYPFVATEARRNFQCPLCGKTFEKSEAQVLHMKACALRHNVTTRQLLDAVELQERQAAERQAMGLPDISATHAIKKSSSKKSGKNGSNSDSNLQLALALSVSMQEAEEREQLQEENCLLEAGLGHEVIEQQKYILESFGFRSSRPAILAPSSSKQKFGIKNRKNNPLLLSRTKEERERLITEKVAIILMGEESSAPSLAMNISHNTKDADTTKSLQKYQNKSCSLWGMGSVSCPEKEFQSYYVEELNKFISPSKVPVGAKLKHISQIPGRSKTPERQSRIMGAKEGFISPVTIVPLSQMEASSSRDTEMAKLREPEARQNLVCPTIDRSTDNSLTRTFVEDWKSFLNKKTMSDLIIYVENDIEIPAHKLVLYVRCKAVLKDVVSEVSSESNRKISDMLLWVDVSYKAALGFLQFLYCGLTNKILQLSEEDLLSVKRLSERYRITELSHYLRAVNSRRGQAIRNKDSSSNLSPCHNSSYYKKQTSLYTSDLGVCSQAANTPRKEIYPKNTYHSLNLDAELTAKNTSVGTDNEFSESRLCSSRSLSPDLFIGDTGEPHEQAVSQESRNSMEYLLNMLGKPSLSQSNTQNSSLLISSEKLTQNNTQTDSAMMSSEKLTQRDAQINSVLMSLDKPSLTDKHVTCSKGLISVDDIENKCDLPTILIPDHTHISENVTDCSPVKIKGQTNLLAENSENPQGPSESRVYSECVPLQDSWEKTVKVDSGFNSVNFLERLISDSDTITSSVRAQREIKQRMETKRKCSDIDIVSNRCRSFVKKVCRGGTEGEVFKKCSNKTENKDESDKLMKSENNVITILDLTQSSSDSESTQPQGLMLSSPVRRSIEGTNIPTHTKKHYSEFTIVSDVLQKSEKIITADKESHSKHFDNGRESAVENNARTAKQRAESDRCMKSDDNVQNDNDWDKFDEMSCASVPHIFSQCLSQLISTHTTSQKSQKLNTSSNELRASQYSGRRSLGLLPSHPESQIQGSLTNYSSSCSRSPVMKGKKISEDVQESQSLSRVKRSLKVNDVLENSLLAQLNDSVFWRDENAPILAVSPKQTVPSNRSNTVDHRTPVQNQTHGIFSDKVTPPADYSAMKTPQLKTELRKYGLKPSLTKGQAKRMLRHIYDQLHPYITVSGSDDDMQASGVESSPFKKPGSDTRVPNSPARKPGVLGTSRSPVRRNLMGSEDVSHRVIPVTQGRNTASQSDAGSDSDDLLSSQRSSSSSAASVREEVLCEELDVFSQGDIPLSQDVCSSANLATVVHDFITTDPDLYQKVLLYEPIWIEQLHANLKANNFKFKMNELMDYLDEQCITFRTAQGQNSRQKKKKKKRQNLAKRKENSHDKTSAKNPSERSTQSDS